MGIKEVPASKRYECDRCGFESENDLARGACLAMSYKMTLLSFTGDLGGNGKDLWLCGNCTDEFVSRFMKGLGTAEVMTMSTVHPAIITEDHESRPVRYWERELSTDWSE